MSSGFTASAPRGPKRLRALRQARPGVLSIKRAAAGLLAALVVAGAFVGPVASAAVLCTGDGRVEQRGNWQIIDAPRFATGEQQLAAHALAPFASSRMVVTNGVEIAGTADGGCSWSSLFTLPEIPNNDYSYSSTTARIETLAIEGGRIYAMVAETAGAERPHVLVSDDDGDSWRAADTGLPPSGSPEALRPVPIAPATAYLAIDAGGGTLDLLFATTDAGVTWSLRSDLSRPLLAEGVTDIQVDPGDPLSVWASGPGGMFHSTDGGAGFTAVDEFADTPTTPLDVARPIFGESQEAFITGFRPETEDLLRSEDGGKTWLRNGTPGVVTSVAHGAFPDFLMMSANDRVYAFVRTVFSWVDVQAPAPGITALAAGRTTDIEFVGRTDTTLYRYGGAAFEENLPDDVIDSLLDIPVLQTPDVPVGAPPKLSGRSGILELDPGESATVPYSLKIFRRAIPLDVFFLVDTTGSMQRYISGVAGGLADIVNGLAESGIDVRFGLGEFRAYPDSFVPRVEEPNFVYRRDLDIPADTESLREGLQRLDAAGGGVFEAQLGALWHMATGRGADLHPKGSPLGQDVPPGLQANYRRKALRVVVMATDAAFGREDFADFDDPRTTGLREPPDIPNFDEVIGALNAKGIYQVGLAITRDPETDGDPNEPGHSALKDLRHVATGTTAFAPSPGVDCSGDGASDLFPGDPLVCPIHPRDLGDARQLVPAIVNLSRAVAPRTSIGLDATRGAAVVRDITPDVYESVVLQSAGRLRFNVTFSCTNDQAGRRVPVRLEASTPRRVLGSVGLLVVCTEEPDVPAPITPLVLIPLLPPPPIPPAVNTVTQAQAQAQSQAQAQGAVASQKQEEPQLAFVRAYEAFRGQLAEEYEFSTLKRKPDPQPGLILGGAGALMGVAFGALSLVRNRVALQRRRW